MEPFGDAIQRTICTKKRRRSLLFFFFFFFGETELHGLLSHGSC